jgi:long-chain acyl-CoA synthetase
MGFKRGNNLAIVGENRPHVHDDDCRAVPWRRALAALSQDAVANEMLFVLLDAEVRFIFVEDQEQVDKVLEIQAQLPQLEQLLYDDPRGMRHYTLPFIHDIRELMAMGRIHNRNHPDLLAMEVAAGASDDVSVMLYTSGTTGKPKGVRLTHHAFARQPITRAVSSRCVPSGAR